MRLTTYTDYALRVLMYLGLKGGTIATVQEIAEQFGISRNHLMKVVQQLGRLGYIETIRGKSGGLRLRRNPATITVGEVVRNLEPDMALVECFHSAGVRCRIVKGCLLKCALQEALDRFLEALDQSTLADLLAPAEALGGSFPMPLPARSGSHGAGGSDGAP